METVCSGDVQIQSPEKNKDRARGTTRWEVLRAGAPTAALKGLNFPENDWNSRLKLTGKTRESLTRLPNYKHRTYQD